MIKIKKYLIPILYTLGIILIGAFLSSILYYFNITSDKLNNILLYLISILGIFTGSVLLSKDIKYKGIINGLLYFIGWFIIMLLLSLIVFKTSIKINDLIYYAVILIFSMLGGIIGKNLKEENDEI